MQSTRRTIISGFARQFLADFVAKVFWSRTVCEREERDSSQGAPQEWRFPRGPWALNMILSVVVSIRRRNAFCNKICQQRAADLVHVRIASALAPSDVRRAH